MKKHKSMQDSVQNKLNSKNQLIMHLLEGGFILILGLSIFVFLSLLTYKTTDPGWFSTGFSVKHDFANAGGKIGAYLADLFYFIFGYAAYLLPIVITYGAGKILLENRNLFKLNKLSLALRSLGLLLVIVSSCCFLSLQVKANALLGIHLSGGLLGKYLAISLNNSLNLYGSLLFLFSVFLVGLTWLTSISWLRVIDFVGYLSLIILRKITASSWLLIKFGLGFFNVFVKFSSLLGKIKIKRDSRNVEVNIIKAAKKAKKPKPENILFANIKTVKANEKTLDLQKTISPSAAKKTSIPSLPEIGLLDKGAVGKQTGGYSNQELESLSHEVEQHLLDFGVNASVVSVHPGPVITRFELQLAAGVKVSRLTALAKDLARSLSVVSVRVVEIIPGKTVVGIELPNPDRAMVRLSEVLSSDVYQKANSVLSLALGVDISGQPMVVDLAKMPHLLVAGTTGSGKSVGINGMILSLLFRATPEQVRLILVDPKMLELSVYDGIPHLLTPVVTDMREAQSALRWCVAEMERRYRLMAAFGVRNIDGFNTRIKEAKAKGEELTDPTWKTGGSDDSDAPILDEIPYVVVVIDELADMMMVVGKKVEQLIARIAQKARASGIHLILATQRPSVDVLTGLIKSNIPTRISYQVSSKIDSRTILDQQGAEQLLGHGDMLFLAPGTGAPLRVHGAFVDDREVHRIADDWRARGAPNYIDVITQTMDDGFDSDGGGEERVSVESSDPLYDQAVEFVIQTRKASISSVQRRFKIGYNRAARLVEEMESSGLVGPLEGGLRDVLVPSSD